jgi:hypothetical protein
MFKNTLIVIYINFFIFIFGIYIKSGHMNCSKRNKSKINQGIKEY